MTDNSRQDSAFLPEPELTQEAFPPLPLCWPTLTEQEKEEHLEALDDWTRWHAHFAAARQRLADWVSRTGCRSGEHRPDSAGP